MRVESGAAGRHGVFEPARATIFLCELRKGNRRRILLDPAPQFLDSRMFRHVVKYLDVPALPLYCTNTFCVTVADAPFESKTLSCTG